MVNEKKWKMKQRPKNQMKGGGGIKGGKLGEGTLVPKGRNGRERKDKEKNKEG